MYVAHERRAYILRLLEQQGHLRSADLARDLGVTDETIRTDLVALQHQGLLQRVHGGARYLLAAPKADSPSRPQGPDSHMADALAERIQPGMCLYLDAAPFSLMLAWRLRDIPCHLVTASPKIMVQLNAKALGHRLFCPGGELDKEGGVFHPAAAEDFLQRMAPDFAILRPAAYHPGMAGYTAAALAQWAQAAAQAAGACCIAIPSSHLGASAPHTFPCTPDILLTGDDLPAEYAGLPGLRTVPAITREDLLPEDRFDY